MAEAGLPLRKYVQPLLLMAGLAAVVVAFRALPLRHFTENAGHMPVAAFLVIGTVACAVGVPRQAVAFAAGYAHGIGGGLLLAMAAQVISCVVDYVWAFAVARSLVRRLLQGRFGHRLGRLDALLAARPFEATLVLRLLPVGNNLLMNLAGGGFGVRLLPFVAASAIGYLPHTLVFALLGAGIRVGRGVVVGLSVVALAASGLLGFVLLRTTKTAELTRDVPAA